MPLSEIFNTILAGILAIVFFAIARRKFLGRLNGALDNFEIAVILGPISLLVLLALMFAGYALMAFIIS